MSGKMSTAFILVNDAMPGFARFETSTKDDIASRLKSINRTELPIPFRIFFAAQVIDCDLLARSMRFLFAEYCVGGDSKFYKIAPEVLRAAVEPSAIAILDYGDGELGISPAMRAQMEHMRAHHDTLQFRALDFEAGQVLRFTRESSLTCTALANGMVEFEGAVVSPGEATVIALRKLGFDWSEATVTDYWRPCPGKPGAVDHIVPSPSNVDPTITAKEMVRETAESSPILFVRNHKA